MREREIKRRNPYHLHRPLEPPQSPTDIVCIGEIEVYRAGCCRNTQPTNHVDGDETYDIGMKDDLANDMGGSGYQKINSVFEVVEEISREAW